MEAKEAISEENTRVNVSRGEQKSNLLCPIGLDSYDLHGGIDYLSF
jgi:hypothetical protein